MISQMQLKSEQAIDCNCCNGYEWNEGQKNFQNITKYEHEKITFSAKNACCKQGLNNQANSEVW